MGAGAGHPRLAPGGRCARVLCPWEGVFAVSCTHLHTYKPTHPSTYPPAHPPVRALLRSTEATPANLAALRAYVSRAAPQAAPFLVEEDLVQVCAERERGWRQCMCVWF